VSIRLFSIGGLVLSSVLMAGCDDSKKTETVEFKKTDTSQFDSMKEAMTKGVTTKNYAPKAATPPAETKP
jgi:hypothetical protein